MHKILYDCDELIEINYDNNNNGMTDINYLFYLNLLINDVQGIINYIYKIDFLRALNDTQNKIKIEKKPYKSFIMAKIIIDLIINYKESEEYSEEEYNDELKKMEHENNRIIEENINKIKLNLDKKYILSESLETIYSNIINTFLLENINDIDYESISNILEQLELDKIYITKKIFLELSKKLNSKNDDFFSKYKIVNIDDIMDESKVNFFYLLLKYILKDTFFIYQIPFLLKVKKLILTAFKKDNEIYRILNNLNNKKDYILKFFLESKYYYNKVISFKLTQIQKYYKEYFFETKADDIKKLENMLNSKIENCEKYLSDFAIAVKMNKRIDLIKYIYESKYKETKLDEEKLTELVDLWNNCEIMIRDKKLTKMSKPFKIALLDYFRDEKNQKQLLEIFPKDSFDNFINIKIENKENKKKSKIDIDDNKNKKIINNELSKNKEDLFFTPIPKEKQEKEEESYVKKSSMDLEEKMAKKLKEAGNKNKNEIQNKFVDEKSFPNSDQKSMLEQYSTTVHYDKNYSPIQYNLETSTNKSKQNQKNRENIMPIDKIIKEKKNYNPENINNKDKSTIASTTIENNEFTKIIKENNNKKINNNEKIVEEKPIEEYKNIIEFSEKLLFKITILINTNEKGKEPYIIYKKIYFENNNIEITYEKLKKNRENFEKIKNVIPSAENYLRFLDFLEEIEEKIRKEFIYNYNLMIKLELNREPDNNDSNPFIYNISCIYTFYPPNNNRLYKYKEENILLNGTNSKLKGFYYLMIDANNEIFKEFEYKIDFKYKEITNNNRNQDKKDKENDKIKTNDSSKIKDEEISFNTIDESTKSRTLLLNEKKIASEETVIEFIRIIGEHKNAADFVEELSDGYLVSGGAENSLLVYNNNFDKKLQITDLNDWVYKVSEKININTNNKNLTLLVAANKEINIIILEKENLKIEIKKYQIPNRTNMNLLEMKQNNIIILGIGGSSYFIDLFSTNNQLQENKINDKTYRGGLKISENLATINSNRVITDGEDNLLIINTKKIKKQAFYKIEGFSFTDSVNNQAELENKNNNYKIIVCGCKKY